MSDEVRKQHDEQIDPLREREHQSYGEDRHRAGHDGRGGHREIQSPQMGYQRIEERHQVERKSEFVVFVRPFERRVTDDRVINPHGGHDAPEKRHDSAVSPRIARHEVIGDGDPRIEKRQKTFHCGFHPVRRAQIETRRQDDGRQHDERLHGPSHRIVVCDSLPKEFHNQLRICFLLRVSECARLLKRKIGAAAPAASMKITLKVTNPLRTMAARYPAAEGSSRFCMNIIIEKTVL